MKRRSLKPSGSSLSRSSPMKRGEPLTRSAPLRPRSKKMAKKYAGPDGRAALVARILSERPGCEVGALIWPSGDGVVAYADGRRYRRTRRGAWVPACTGRSRDVHEVLSRSAGGDILDERICRAACGLCHDWVGNNPKEARALGLRLSRYAGRNPTPTTAPETT